MKKSENVRRIAGTQDIVPPEGPCNVFRFRGISTSIHRDEAGEFIEMVVPVRPVSEAFRNALKELDLTEAQQFEIKESLGNMTAMNFLMAHRE